VCAACTVRGVVWWDEVEAEVSVSSCVAGPRAGPNFSSKVLTEGQAKATYEAQAVGCLSASSLC
jgi:hypothetical protein